MKSLPTCLAMVALSASAHAQLPREAAVSASPAVSPRIQPPSGSPASSTWIMSETRSPVDYSPVAVATSSSDGLQIAIQCRGGRTEMVLSSTSNVPRPQDVLVSYAIDGVAAVTVAVAAAESGGLALKGDVPRFLMSLPEQGEIALRVTARTGGAIEGRYSLGALRKLVGRLAGPCAWPVATGR